MSGAVEHQLLALLLPPASGAILGFLLGSLAFGRIARAMLLRRGARIAGSITESSFPLASQLLAVKAASVVPAAGTASARRLEDTLAGMLGAILGSRATIYAVRDAVGKLVGGLVVRGVGDTARALGIERLLAQRILAALGAQRNRAAIASSAGKLVAEKAGAGIDDEVIRELSALVDSAVPEAADAAVRWLRSAETRTYLSERGRELLPRILEKLSDLQKLFLTAAQFDRRLNEKMPEIVDETVAALEQMVRDPRQQKRIVAVFSDAARGWRDSLLVGAAGPGRTLNEGQQKLSDSVSRLVDRLLERLDDPQERQALAGRAAVRLDAERRPLGAFLRDTVGLGEQDIVEVVSDRVLRLLTGPQTARNIAARLSALILARAQEEPEATIGSALGMDGSRRQELDAMLRSAVPGVVQRALPRLLGAPAARRGVDLLLGVLGAGAGLLAGAALSALRLAGFP